MVTYYDEDDDDDEVAECRFLKGRRTQTEIRSSQTCGPNCLLLLLTSLTDLRQDINISF